MEKLLPILRRWVWCLTIAAVVLLPSFREIDYKTYGVTIGFLLLLLLEAIYFIKKPEFFYSPLEIYLVLYVGWTCLSFFWSQVDLAASEYLGRFLPCVGFYLLARQQDRQEDGMRLAFWYGAAILVMLYGLAQGLHLDFISAYSPVSSNRIFSTFGNPNVYGAFLVLSFPILCPGMAKLNNSVPQIAVLGSFLLLFLLSLALTQSRAGFVGLAVEFSVLLYLLWPKMKGMGYGKWALLAFAAVVLCFFCVKVSVFALRPTERPEVWKGAIQMIAQRPLQGWGIGQFEFNFSSYATPEVAGQMQKDNTFGEHAHNEVLELGIELGLIGLVLAAIFWCRLLERGARQIFKQPAGGAAEATFTAGLTIGLLGVGVTNLFDYNCRLSGVAFFIWLSAALLANRVFPADKMKLPAFLGLMIGLLVLGAAGFGLFQETRLLAAVLKENPEKDFLKEIPADFASEQSRLLENIKNQPSNPANYHQLGQLYAKLGKMEEARKAFEKEIELDPRSSEAYLDLGNVYLLSSENNLGQIQLARECYEKAIELDPMSAGAHCNLAYVYFLHKDLKKAMEELDKALKIDPQNTQALSLKRQILP